MWHLFKSKMSSPVPYLKTDFEICSQQTKGRSRVVPEPPDRVSYSCGLQPSTVGLTETHWMPPFVKLVFFSYTAQVSKQASEQPALNFKWYVGRTSNVKKIERKHRHTHPTCWHWRPGSNMGINDSLDS